MFLILCFCVSELMLLFSLNRLCVRFGLVSLKEMFCLCSCILEHVVFEL